MACPDAAKFGTDAFQTAIESLDLWQAGYCAFATPLGELAVGSIVYAGFGLNIYIRTGSAIIPLILMLILGGTVLAQTWAVISAFAALVILVGAPLVATGLVMLVGRRG